MYANIGNRINRIGIDGNARNPFEIVPGLRYTFGAMARPLANITNGLLYREYHLWIKYGADEITGLKNLRKAVSYQLN